MSLGKIHQLQIRADSKVYLSSDYHFYPNSSYGLLDRYLNQIEVGDECIFGGDFFEVWYENFWGSYSSGYEALLTLIQQHVKRGVLISFLVGNRDFLAGSVLAKKSSLKVFDGQLLLSFKERRLLLIHGDELLPDDLSYRKFKAWVRNPFVMNLAKCLPEILLRPIVQGTRAKSKEKVAKLDYNAFPKSLKEILPIMDEYQVKQAIAGHVHVNETIVESYQSREYECITLADSTPKKITYRIYSQQGLSDVLELHD